MLTQAELEPAVEREECVSGYFDSFGPGPAWEQLVEWPPDVFALANLLLDHTEAYRFAVAPPPGARWPPLRGWNERARDAAESWRRAAHRFRGSLPGLVGQSGRVVTRGRDTPLARVRSGESWELIAALLTLHAIADEACAEVVRGGRQGATSPFEVRAWQLLQE